MAMEGIQYLNLTRIVLAFVMVYDTFVFYF